MNLKLLSSVILGLLLGCAAVMGQTARGIVNDKITVPPKKAWTQLFDVPGDWRVGVVNGRFRAEGGSGNDITVYILDEDGFENWKNGHQAPTYYNSGKVTVGTVRTRLRPGRYYLILDNRDSLVSNKVVIITVGVAAE